jgi:hypothetical protein
MSRRALRKDKLTAKYECRLSAKNYRGLSEKDGERQHFDTGRLAMLFWTSLRNTTKAYK